MNKHHRYIPKLKPLPHQATDSQALRNGGIQKADEQGLGKSKQAYDTAAQLIADGQIDLALVIAKASTRDNFLNEVQADAHQLRALVVDGSRRERSLKYRLLAHHLLILSYETVVADLEELLRISSCNRVALLVDESHYIKNPKSQRSQAVLQLGEQCKIVNNFSGTPAPNTQADIYAQLKLLKKDVGGDLKEFKEKYPTIEEVRGVLEECLIRRRKSEVTKDLKPKKYLEYLVQLDGIQKDLYEEAKEQLSVGLPRGKQPARVQINGVLARLTRLLQISSHPGILFRDYNETPAKLRALDSIIQETMAVPGRKLIIWTSFRGTAEAVLDRYKDMNPVALHGGVQGRQKSLNARRFQLDPTVRIMVAIPACAREGFTLTAANLAVYVDRSFSALDWLQSQDRIHRIGQKRQAIIMVLKAAGTIDEKIDEILRLKETNQRYLLGDEDTPISDKAMLEQLRKLL